MTKRAVNLEIQVLSHSGVDHTFHLTWDFLDRVLLHCAAEGFSLVECLQSSSHKPASCRKPKAVSHQEAPDCSLQDSIRVDMDTEMRDCDCSIENVRANLALYVCLTC